MICLDDLGQVARDLRKRGIDAEHDFLYGPYGCVEGLDVCDDFFPLWELSLPQNADALERADFDAIKQARGADWAIGAPVRSAAQ